MFEQVLQEKTKKGVPGSRDRQAESAILRSSPGFSPWIQLGSLRSRVTIIGRNLVILCDGTSNHFGGHKTNVARLAKCVVRSERQLVYYDPGVGTLPEPDLLSKVHANVRRWISLATGFGLTQNVQEAYTYLMDYWQPGDKVFLFGFSRGAYTVRVLAGLLHILGLLPPGNHQLSRT
jgi:uncharacterized protein (DUF2235 family)